MKKAILWTGLAVVALVAQPALAICDNSAGFTQTPKGGTFDYNYLVFGTDSTSGGGAQDGAGLAGKFWRLGSRATANEGTTATSDWVLTFAGAWYIDGNWASLPGTVGCASGNPMAIVVEDRTLDGSAGLFAAGAADSFVVCPREWDMSGDANFNCATRPTRTWADWTGQPIPRPRVTGSSRVAPNVVLDLQFDDVASGFFNGGNGRSAYSVITGYVVKTQTLLKTAPAPGAANTAAWTAIANTATAAGGASIAGVSVNCADPNTFVYVATALQFDGGDQSSYVSQPTVVECDPTLADPDRFKLIDKPSKPGKIKVEKGR